MDWVSFEKQKFLSFHDTRDASSTKKNHKISDF